MKSGGRTTRGTQESGPMEGKEQESCKKRPCKSPPNSNIFLPFVYDLNPSFISIFSLSSNRQEQIIAIDSGITHLPPSLRSNFLPDWLVRFAKPEWLLWHGKHDMNVSMKYIKKYIFKRQATFLSCFK